MDLGLGMQVMQKANFTFSVGELYMGHHLQYSTEQAESGISYVEISFS